MIDVKQIDMEQQVCSLELSRKLKELEVKQESLFYWRDNDGFDNCNETDYSIVEYINPNVTIWFASAFTASELGLILPSNIEKNNISGSQDSSPYILISEKKYDMWFVYYQDDVFSTLIGSANKNEANARAALLCSLIEGGHIKHDQ